MHSSMLMLIQTNELSCRCWLQSSAPRYQLVCASLTRYFTVCDFSLCAVFESSTFGLPELKRAQLCGRTT